MTAEDDAVNVEATVAYEQDCVVEGVAEDGQGLFELRTFPDGNRGLGARLHGRRVWTGIGVGMGRWDVDWGEASEVIEVREVSEVRYDWQA